MNDLITSKKQIMRRVYIIWLFRTMFNATTIKLGALGILFWQLTVHVSLKQVVANWHFDWGISGSYAFVESALVNTEFVTQLLILGMGVVVFLLGRDMVRKERQATQGLFVRI